MNEKYTQMTPEEASEALEKLNEGRELPEHDPTDDYALGKEATLYRGFIVYTYDANETVEPVKAAHGGFEWQSRERLEEELQRLASVFRGDPKDVGGYTEEVKVTRVALKQS